MQSTGVQPSSRNATFATQAPETLRNWPEQCWVCLMVCVGGTLRFRPRPPGRGVLHPATVRTIRCVRGGKYSPRPRSGNTADRPSSDPMGRLHSAYMSHDYAPYQPAPPTPCSKHDISNMFQHRVDSEDNQPGMARKSTIAYSHQEFRHEVNFLPPLQNAMLAAYIGQCQ